MAGQTSFSEFLFSSAGRLARWPFLLALLVLVLLAGALRALIPNDLSWIERVGYAPLLFIAACVIAKRFHDYGRAGWWGGVVLVAVVGLWSGQRGIIGFVEVLVLAWAAVQLFLTAGDHGSNGFGPRDSGGIIASA